MKTQITYNKSDNYCHDALSIAKLSSSSSPVELSTALILIISTPTPGIVVMRQF